MKHFSYYMISALIVIVLLPLIIVKSCSYQIIKEEPVPQMESTKIQVYITADKRVEEMNLEEYLKGVLAAEMPADFHLEALKAQAVAARTYAYGRIIRKYGNGGEDIFGADVSTNPQHCQAWISKSQALKNWGSKGAENWAKIEKAVNDTYDLILVYNGQVVNPVFHSNSGGCTENSEDVWDGVAEPYLRAVKSPGEDRCADYKSITTISVEDFISTIKKTYPKFTIQTKNLLSQVKIAEYTTGGRVKIIKIGNISMKGTEFRTIFSLRSANFKIEMENSTTLRITCLGYGHGVGMSQWGANYLASKGSSFEDILKYYYTGVELDSIDSIKLRSAYLSGNGQ